MIGKARANVDFVVDILRPITAEFHPHRGQPHGRADGGNVGAVLRRLGAIDVEHPVDARQRQAVFDIDETADLGQCGFDAQGHGGQQRGIARRQFDLYRLAGGRTMLLLVGVDDDPGDGLSTPTDFVQDPIGLGTGVPV